MLVEPNQPRSQASADAQDAHLSRLKLKWRVGVRAAHQMLMIRQRCPCFQRCAASPQSKPPLGKEDALVCVRAA